MNMNNIIDRGPTLGTLALNPDYYRGLREATDNGQLRIAMEYATRTIAELWDSIHGLSQQVAAIQADLEEFKAAKAPYRKVSKGNTPAEPPKDLHPDEPQPD